MEDHNRALPIERRSSRVHQNLVQVLQFGTVGEVTSLRRTAKAIEAVLHYPVERGVGRVDGLQAYVCRPIRALVEGNRTVVVRGMGFCSVVPDSESLWIESIFRW